MTKKGLKGTEEAHVLTYEPGLKLEVGDFKGNWYPAKVLEVDLEEGEVLVHYDKWSSRFDEWIKTDSNRLRPFKESHPTKTQFKVGEKVEALWNVDGHRYPGTVKAIHANDYYEVLFDDGIKCRKKASQIFKIPAKILEDSKPSSPTKSRRSSLDLAEPPPEVPPEDPKPSIFEPVPTDLGKRKRVHHDYSLFLKIPRSTSKPPAEEETKKSHKKGRKSIKSEAEIIQLPEDPPEDPPEVPSSEEIPIKRSRKSSIKAIENIAAADDLSSRRKSSRRSLPVQNLPPQQQQQPSSPPPPEPSSFIDEKGNTVDIKQTSDGGWICPLEKCGKQFRKDALLQMHLKHYHPSSKIQFLGNRMNVFEMAIARTSSSEDKLPLPEPAIPPKITRSKSSHSEVEVLEVKTEVPEAVPEVPEEKSGKSLPERAEAIEIKEEDPEILNELNPGNTNVCVLLEKINLNKYETTTTAKKKISGRGRFLRWSKNYSCSFKAKKLDLICDELVKLGFKKRLLAQPRFEDVPVDIINCECGLEEEFGLMMQCELCQAWQHGNCYDIYEVSQLPQYYVCVFCREPKSLRPSKQNEWYQEPNTTGRLPKFSFGNSPPNPPELEHRIRETNDLLNTVSHMELLLRSTQLKISLLNSKEENPKLLLWSRDPYDPSVETAKEDFRLNYRSVLRHLLKHSRHDPYFIQKLRGAVQERQEQGTPESQRVKSMLRQRFDSRAREMMKNWDSKEEEIQNQNQNQILHVNSLNELQLCGKCKEAIHVDWSRKDFAKTNGICRNCSVCEGGSSTVRGLKGVKSLRNLCKERLNQLGEENKERLIGLVAGKSTEGKLKPAKGGGRRDVGERCRVNLHATIVKEQALMEMHLDSTEGKLRELEESLRADPGSALARLKDLEKLKTKVKAVNESILFMRKVKPEGVELI